MADLIEQDHAAHGESERRADHHGDHEARDDTGERDAEMIGQIALRRFFDDARDYLKRRRQAARIVRDDGRELPEQQKESDRRDRPENALPGYRAFAFTGAAFG